MHIRNNLQYKIATGRSTLPVAILISLLLYGITYQTRTDFIPLAISGAIAYMLIKINFTFALIRTRTMLPSALFLLFYSTFPFLHGYSTESWIPLLFTGIIFSLFKSYESSQASKTVFHAFLMIGVCSLITPYMLCFIPFLYIHMITMRSLNLRTFFAGLTGIIIPYWLMSCYYLYMGNVENIRTIFQLNFFHLPIDYSILSVQQITAEIMVFLLTAVSCIQNISYSYQDKVQTRIMLHTLMFIEAESTLLLCLQPQHFNTLFSIQLILGAIINCHLFALTFNRFTHIFLIINLISWFALTVFNLWMFLFNF